MKKNIFIILIIGLLILSITINFSAFSRLNKSYEKINEAIASDYLKIDEAFVNLNRDLKEDTNLTSEDLMMLYESYLSSEHHNTVYGYVMDINHFKWLNEDYNYANLDELASYLIYLQTYLNDTYAHNMKEIKAALIDLCSEWQEMHLSRAIVNDTYNFQTDPQNLSKVLTEFNDYCHNCIDKKSQ